MVFIFSRFHFSVLEIGPATKTSNVTFFKLMLQELRVGGGTDCPEMSLSAIREGLEMSSFNSFIFVFTDADPKDVELLPEILSAVRHKNSQVT